MSEAVQTARAELEMDLEEPAPEGVLTSTDGRSFRFSGWTELAAAIEQWRSDAASAPSREIEPPTERRAHARAAGTES